MMTDVSLLCDYFVAASVSHAAETIDWVGGPGLPPEGHDAPGATIALPGIEPVVLLGQLEAVLTGRSLMDEILSDDGHKHVAIRDSGERLVIPIGSRLEVALAALAQHDVSEIARRWSEAEEFGGMVTPRQLEDALAALASVARAARDQGHHVYCWMCV